MDAHTFISLTRQTLDDVERAGVKTIQPAALREFLSYLENMAGPAERPTQELTPAQLEHYKAQLASWVAQQQHLQASSLEGFRQVIQLAQAALKTVLLINGGAAVALLALLGHLVSSKTGLAGMHMFACAACSFAAGVLLAGVATCTTYLTQLAYNGWPQRLWVAISLHVVTVIIVVAAFVAFALGAGAAYRGFLLGVP